MRLHTKTLLAAGVFALLSGAANAVTLKWAHVYETSEPYHKWTVWAGDEIKKRTNGKYEIQVYPASQLGKESDINQGLTTGQVDLLVTGGSFMARFEPRFGISYYPFIFRDLDHLKKYTTSDVFKDVTGALEKKTGAHVTAVTYYGSRHTISNKPFKDCASMKGQKMRVPDAVTFLAMPKACGANPAPIAYAETYLAVQNGTVDGLENPLTGIEAKKFYEVAKNVMLTAHMVDHIYSMVGGHIWSKLSDEEKKIFTDVMREAADKATADVLKREGELVAEFKAKGLKFVDVDRESIKKTILQKQPPASMGYQQSDFDRIQAIK